MEIRDTQRPGQGIVERRFTVAGAQGAVPGVLWTPVGAAAQVPLILLGHGGSGSKEAPNIIESRDAFAAHGIATAAIDGPVHGERGGLTDTADPRYTAMWRTPGAIDGMIVDWRNTLDALLALGEFAPSAIGYHGLSMGTMFGLPFVASEPRIAAAVLGLCGLRGTSIDRSRIETRLAADAPRVTCPLMFHAQWDDTQFLRDSAFELYALLGAADKRLQSTPGGHGDTPAEARATLRTFLARRLLARAASDAR